MYHPVLMLTSDLWIWIGMTLSRGLWGCCCCCCSWKASTEGRLPVLALFHVPMSLKKAACGDIGPRSKSMSEESNTELGKPDAKGTATLEGYSVLQAKNSFRNSSLTFDAERIREEGVLLLQLLGRSIRSQRRGRGGSPPQRFHCRSGPDRRRGLRDPPRGPHVE